MKCGLSLVAPTLILTTLFAVNANAVVFYEDDFEEGIKYVGVNNPHEGGGYVVFLGGEIVGGIVPGDGTQNFQKFTNVILDSSTDAANATSGSSSSLKTQYRAGHKADFGLNTTIISFPETDNVYIRWYQKWSEDWSWPTDQQKLAKVKGAEQSQNFKLSWGNNYINVTKKSPPPYEDYNETYVFADLSEIREAPSAWRESDSDDTTDNYRLETNRWYCIEIMVRSNTPNLSDGQLTYWIDDARRFHLSNTSNRGASNRGISHVELQHVLQTEGESNFVDTPTWMDNIVISDQRISCAGQYPTGVSSPRPPSNLNLKVQ